MKGARYGYITGDGRWKNIAITGVSGRLRRRLREKKKKAEKYLGLPLTLGDGSETSPWE